MIWNPWPNLALMCWGPPRHWKVPRTMMASLSHSASHSSMLCEVRMIDVPDLGNTISRVLQ